MGLQDLIPYLVLHQHASTKAAAALRPDSSGTPSANRRPEPGSMAAPGNAEQLSPGASFCLCSRHRSDAGASINQTQVRRGISRKMIRLFPLHGRPQGAECKWRMHPCIWLLEHSWLEVSKNASNATGCDYMSMSHTSAVVDETAAGTSYCGAFVAAPEQYCARTVNLQSFSEVNR